MKKLRWSLLLFVLVAGDLYAQDTLPKFSVKSTGNNRIIISWSNNFKSIRQISIQRSFDSLRNFRSILTVPDPATPQNGFVDTKATNDHMFYRIYMLLEGGVYMFSDAKRPVIDTAQKIKPALLVKIAENTLDKKVGDSIRRSMILTDRMNKIGSMDSVANLDVGIDHKNKPEVFIASLHVYTYKDGYVRINLPDDENKKYSIRFSEEDGSFLFELKDIKVRTFKLDKSSFYHAGWFKFELYENGKMIEKHKFYLEKDF